MTQKDLDRVASVMNEATTQLRVAKDKLDTQERIIKAQDEMIELLKSNLQDRDKMIAILESQLRNQCNALNNNWAEK
jgi:predicted RNase H-like nuclease (RuvC/YqgF family)